MVAKQLIILVFLLGAAWAEVENDPESQSTFEQKALKNAIAQAFTDKCTRNGGPDFIANAEQLDKKLYTCLEAVEPTKDIIIKTIGDQVEVFKKFCAKKPQVNGCIKDTLDSVRPCFTGDEQKNLNDVTEQLLEFFCFKDGHRIASFFAEDELRSCLNSQQDALLACATSTLGFDLNNITADNLADIINFGAEECNQMAALQSCVIEKLEICLQPTTVITVEALFKSIRTPCKNFDSSASGLAVTSLTLIMAAASLLV